MPARKPNRRDLQSVRDSVMRKTESDYGKMESAADAVNGNISKKFQQTMDSTRKHYNKTADDYASEFVRRDSVENVKYTNKIRQAKSPAKEMGGEVTPIPRYNKSKRRGT